MTSFKLILGALFGLLVVAITVLGLISYRSNEAVNDTAQMVQNTQQVLDVAEEISSLSKDLQLESNGLFINRDSAFLSPYNFARTEIEKKLTLLHELIKDEEVQHSNADSLEALIAGLITFADSALLVYNQEKSSVWNDPSKEQVLLRRIEQANIFRAAIRSVINDIKSKEQYALGLREKANEDSIKSFNTAFIYLLAGIIALLVVTFMAIRYNFNKRVLVEYKLKHANELFSKLFNESPIGIVISEADSGIITDCNRAYAELINYTREEMLGKTAVQLKILDSENQREGIINIAREHGKLKDHELYLKPKDREPIWASVSIQTIHVREKACLMSAVIDMTPHRKAEENIKNALAAEIELSQMKSGFVSMASHEFRTPLTTILSSAFLLEKYLIDETQKQVAKHLGRIKSSVNNLTSILDEFLSLTKIEEGKVEPKIEKLNLEEYLQNICKNLKSFTKPGQQIIYSHTGDVNVYSDPVLLASIVNNLLTNAIKYSPENSDIYVSSEMNDCIHLKVQDMGIGIPPEDKKYLFERFYRASNAGTVQGTGLGLHIMKHYVDMLHGSIEVESELGKGTDFRIKFKNLLPVRES